MQTPETVLHFWFHELAPEQQSIVVVKSIN